MKQWNWRPIETAPNDMQPVLVFVPGSRVGILQEEPDMVHVAFRKRDSYRLQDADHIHVRPTHWMPIPAPPEISDLARRALDDE